MKYQVIEERWARIKEVPLQSGSHAPDSQFCVMEAVAFVAGEPWSDTPACACPIISAFMRRWNDYLPTDADRDRLLKAFVPRLVGTRNPALEVKRAVMIGDWTVRTVLPEVLRLYKRDVEATRLSELPEISTPAELARDLALALDLARDLALALDLALDRALARDQRLEESQSALVERMIGATCEEG